MPLDEALMVQEPDYEEDSYGHTIYHTHCDYTETEFAYYTRWHEADFESGNETPRCDKNPLCKWTWFESKANNGQIQDMLLEEAELTF